jgi:hypothetical protein
MSRGRLAIRALGATQPFSRLALPFLPADEPGRSVVV